MRLVALYRSSLLHALPPRCDIAYADKHLNTTLFRACCACCVMASLAAVNSLFAAHMHLYRAPRSRRMFFSCAR